MTNPAFTTPSYSIDPNLSETALTAVEHAKRSDEIGMTHKEILNEIAMFYEDDEKAILAVHKFLEDNMIERYKASFNQRPGASVIDARAA